MNFSALDVFARSDDFEDRAASYQFRAWQWGMLHEFDGRAELRDVAMAGGIDLDSAIDFARECASEALVYVVTLTLHDYRHANGIDVPAARPEAYAPMEGLGEYVSAVPERMMEHHEPTPVQHEAEADHHEPFAEYAAEVAPSADDAHYHHAQEPAAEHAIEPVAGDREEPFAEYHAEAFAEYHAEPVAEYHVEPVAEYHDEPVAEDHEEPVAENHEPVEERAPMSMEFFGSEPAAYVEPEYAAHEDAARTVADLMSMAPPAPAEPASHGVSFEIGGADEAGPSEVHASENGHAAQNGHSSYAWEPLSLVTTVDTTPFELEQTSQDMPDGISISLSPGIDADTDHAAPAPQADDAEHAAPAEHEYDYAAAAPDRGSISFSFSPEMELPPPAAAAPMPAYVAPEAARPAAAAPQPQPAPAVSAPPEKSDLVGNLIARAFTFRIK